MNPYPDEVGDHTPEEQMEAVRESRVIGELEGMMEDKPHYLVIAYRVFPNGTTDHQLVTDTAVATAIGEKSGLGAPTDPGGWGIWEIGEV